MDDFQDRLRARLGRVSVNDVPPDELEAVIHHLIGLTLTGDERTLLKRAGERIATGNDRIAALEAFKDHTRDGGKVH